LLEATKIGLAFASVPPMFANLLSSHCQLECKTTTENKICHEVKLLGCDLMWKICIPLLPLVNCILRIQVRLMSPQAVVILRHLEKLRMGDFVSCRAGARQVAIEHGGGNDAASKIENATVHSFRSSSAIGPETKRSARADRSRSGHVISDKAKPKRTTNIVRMRQTFCPPPSARKSMEAMMPKRKRKLPISFRGQRTGMCDEEVI
jgi:hypothetical protein